eukprot:3123399-Heterocapsa_arctica.AAC.1
MFGKGQHQRIQELQVRHGPQSDTGAVENNGNKCPVHELVNSGEDRQALQHPDESECEGAEGVEQIGSSSNPKRPGLAVRTIEQANAGCMANDGGMQVERTRQLSGICAIQGSGQQEIQTSARQ